MNKLLCYLIIGTFCSFNVGFSSQSHASDILPENVLKVGYLYNFALLTQWPKQRHAKVFELCFYGDKSFGKALRAIEGKQLDDKAININYIEKINDVDKCHLLYVTKSSSNKVDTLDDLAKQANTKSILTVTDDSLLSDKDIIIFLRPQGKRIVFDINAKKAKQEQLHISSRLLRLSSRH